METLESLTTKLISAAEVKTVVKTMKAVAAANIVQYEQSVTALEDYYQAISLGLAAYLRIDPTERVAGSAEKSKPARPTSVIVVFGSEQGLVGRFNDKMADFVKKSMKNIAGSKVIWAVSERIHSLLDDGPHSVTQSFDVPRSVNSITPLVSKLLMTAQAGIEKNSLNALYVAYNQTRNGMGYAPYIQRVLPMDNTWRKEFEGKVWPTKQRPQVLGSADSAGTALIREYLFVVLFRACAESLTSENASRLMAMQRAEKNIGEMIDSLNQRYHRQRQSAIDAELFDLLTGFNSLSKE